MPVWTRTGSVGSRSCQAEAAVRSLRSMWEWRDAWILQAIVYAGRRGSLRSILANADAINVDVPPREVLEPVVRRLQAADLVVAEPSRVRATRLGKRLVRRSSRLRDGLRTITPKLEAALREHVPVPDHSGEWSLSDREWQAAYDDYFRTATHE